MPGNPYPLAWKTTSSLVYSLCDPIAAAAKVERTNYNPIVDFVWGRLEGAPDYLRLALRIAGLIFSFGALFSGGAVFHRLSPESRRRYLLRWKNSSIPSLRDFVRLYESFVLLAFFSRLDA